MANKPAVALFVILTFSITACMSWTQADAKRLWAEQQDAAIAGRKNIESYLNPRSAVVLIDKKEVKPGIMEYSFEYKRAKWFTSAEEKCRFIVVVNDNSDQMIGWRYNGNPEYCTANP